MQNHSHTNFLQSITQSHGNTSLPCSAADVHRCTQLLKPGQKNVRWNPTMLQRMESNSRWNLAHSYVYTARWIPVIPRYLTLCYSIRKIQSHRADRSRININTTNWLLFNEKDITPKHTTLFADTLKEKVKLYQRKKMNAWLTLSGSWVDRPTLALTVIQRKIYNFGQHLPWPHRYASRKNYEGIPTKFLRVTSFP